MKKFVFILLCLFVFPFNSFGEEPSKQERTFTGKLDLPEAAEPGYYPGMETDFITTEGKCYSISNTNEEVLKQVEKYCTPKCKITAIIVMDTYLHKIIKIETVKEDCNEIDAATNNKVVD